MQPARFRRAARGAPQPRAFMRQNPDAILIGPDQNWLTSEQFFEAIRVNLEKEMDSW